MERHASGRSGDRHTMERRRTGPDQAGCDQAVVPPTIDGQVVKVDLARERVTVRATDGTTHEFQATKETLQDFKPGDRITAKLRKAPPC